MSLLATALPAFEIKQILNLIRVPLTAVGEAIHAQSQAFDPAVQESVSYACQSSGKQLRPALALLTAGATGEIQQKHVDLGVIIELIHLATLIHDDIMDGAETRRDQPTVNARWGNTISVLLGDSLFAHALSLSTQFEKADISRTIAKAAMNVCTGEIIQNQRRFDLNLSFEDYFRIIELKTASLFATAAELGARLNDSSEEIALALGQYGMALGTAYQIYDDCLDVAGEETAAGKTLGTDFIKGKLTLPVLYLRQSLEATERKQLDQLLLQKNVSQNADTLRQLIRSNDSLTQTIEYSENLLNTANLNLEKLPPSAYKKALQHIGHQLIQMIRKLE